MEIQKEVHFFKSLFDAVPSPVFFKDTKGVYRFCNKAFAEYSGLPKKEIIGRTDYDLNSKKVAAAYHEIDLMLIQNRQVQYYEVSFKNADGTRQDIIFNKACYVNENGLVTGLVGVLIDVTERRRVEEERQRLAQELQKAFAEIRILKEVLPICSYCGKIRNDEGSWLKIESYIEDLIGTKFSHGICTECVKKKYPKYHEKKVHKEE